MKSRLDDRLIAEGEFATRDEALRSIIAGEVLVDDVVASSGAQKVSEDSVIRLKGKKRYVSRGGHKLKGAIDAFGVDVTGLRCVDIGSSTGGFSDCLLQEGASGVTCVDVNYGQLAWSIRNSPKTIIFERTNIKQVEPAQIGAPFDLIAIDVSFIGLVSLAQVLAAMSHTGTKLIALVKPQFEAKRDESVHGVVLDEAIRIRTVEEVEQALNLNGFETMGIAESPIVGPAGNIEYLIYAKYVK